MRCKRPPARICPDTGQTHDIQGFGPLFRIIADKIEALLADKGHDADAIREELTKADVEAVIPAKSNRREPIAHDREKTVGATSPSACSTSSRTGGVSQPDTTKPWNPISALSISCQSSSGHPLATRPNIKKSCSAANSARCNSRIFLPSADEPIQHSTGSFKSVYGCFRGSNSLTGNAR